MKKLLITAVIGITSMSLFAQQQQGDLAIQFSGNYFSQKVTFGDFESKYYVGNVYIKMGKFFTQNLEFGVKPNITFFPEDEFEVVNNEVKTKRKLRTNVGFGIYGTYSFLTADAKFMPYGGAEISYVPSGDESTVNLGPYAGVKYFITEKINLDANISYLFGLGSTYGTTDDVKIGGLFNVNLGIGVILGKLN
ncbi:MAG: outer membrane beta-barrel protein [Cyclobacteriaceae bacterium]